MHAWLLITEKIATLQELETFWSLSDLMKCHATLEFKNEISTERIKKLTPKKNRSG